MSHNLYAGALICHCWMSWVKKKEKSDLIVVFLHKNCVKKLSIFTAIE